MLSMEWDASGAERALSDWISKMRDLSGILPSIGEIMHTSVAMNFREERTPKGAPWKPSKRVLAEGGQTLSDSGRLRNSIHWAVTGPREVMLGTSVVYAAIHNFGGMAGRGRKVHIPQREYMGIRREDMAEIETVLRDFFTACLCVARRQGRA